MKQEIIKTEHGSCLCTFYNNGKANVMIVDSVEVEEQYRGQGVGTKLTQKVIELAKNRGVDSIELNVNKDNIQAKKLYERAGFIKTNKDYYRMILNRWQT